MSVQPIDGKESDDQRDIDNFEVYWKLSNNKGSPVVTILFVDEVLLDSFSQIKQ